MNHKKVIVITGTSKGIGNFLAKHFLNDNIVIGCSRKNVAIKSPNYTHFSLDITDEKAVLKMFKNIRRNGRVQLCRV